MRRSVTTNLQCLSAPRAAPAITRTRRYLACWPFDRISLLAAVGALVVAVPSHAQTAIYEPPKQVTLSPTGVDLVSGHFTTKTVDLSIGPLALERSYIGGHTIQGSDYFGLNWTHNYANYVVEGEYGKTWKTRVVIGRSAFHFTNWGSYYSSNNPDSFGSTLQLVGGAFIYTDPQGNVYTFNASVNAFPPILGLRNQRIARIDYADGHTLTYSYNASGKLIQIASNRGYSLVFEYGANGYVSKACGYNRAVTWVSTTPTCTSPAPIVSYGYGAAGLANVTSVTDVSGQVWGYDYNDNGNLSRLSCVRQVNSSACLVSNIYTGDWPARVVQQVNADGGVWNYNYDVPDKSGDDPQLPGEPLPYSSGSYSGPEGLNAGAVFGAGLLNSYTESFNPEPQNPWAEVRRTTNATWDGIELHSLAYSEGNKIEYNRDIRQNIVSEVWTPKPGSALSPVSRSTAFPDPNADDCTSVVRRICNKPLSKTDYKGNQTSYTYDPAHGGVLTETGPADAAGVHPVKRYAYAQRYAWIKTSAGGYAQATSPLWLLTSEKTCRTSATISGACSAGASDEVTTSYDYGPDSGPNTLLLRGKVVTADGISLRTCYAYDVQGNKISETSPRAGLTVCP